MKKIALISFSLLSLYAGAQKIKLENGKTFKLTSTIETTGEIMGQDMNNNISTVSTVKIVSLENGKYKGTNTVTSMKMVASIMGQDMNFDSDKKEDLTSPMGEKASATLNKPKDISIDANTGEQVLSTKGEDDDSGLGMFGGGDIKSNTGIFFMTALSKKLGDKWSENTELGGLKVTTNYEIQIIAGGKITVAINAITKGVMTKDMNGQSLDMNIETKTIGSYIVNSTTGLLEKQITTGDATVNMDIQGQSMTVTNKTKSTIIVE